MRRLTHHSGRLGRFVALLLLAAACQPAEELERPAESTPVSRAQMDLQIDRWDAATKADEPDFKSGSRIYIQLVAGERQKVIGVVTRDDGASWSLESYALNESQTGWTTAPDPDLSGFSGGHCACYYFESRWNNRGEWFGDETHFGINLNAEFAVYEDPDAIYGISDGEINFRIHLKPKTGRIRFAPYSNSDYYHPDVFGMTWCSYLDMNSFTLESSSRVISSYISGDADSYIYGSFPDPGRKTLTVVNSWRPYFERTFSEDILAPGRSNWVYVPVEERHNEWYRIQNSISGHGFGLYDLYLRYVVPGSFRMGGDDALPVHTVTLTKGYYIADSEITRDMWYSVMGEPSDYVNSSLPVTGKTWEEVQEFIAALNAKSHLDFRLPTEAEWEFAARGGLRSEGYRYSGSDSWSDVAVRGGNWTPQVVKTKKSNELELYDMSGNVSEWVADWYGAYPNGAVVDPSGPASGLTHVRRGGNRGQSDSYLSVSFRDTDSDLSMTGFRLVLDAVKIR